MSESKEKILEDLNKIQRENAERIFKCLGITQTEVLVKKLNEIIEENR